MFYNYFCKFLQNNTITIVFTSVNNKMYTQM